MASRFEPTCVSPFNSKSEPESKFIMNHSYPFSLRWLLTLSVLAVSLWRFPVQGAGELSLKEYFESDEFQKRFLGSYGIDSNVEPKFKTADEQKLFAEIRPLVFDQPEEAISKLEKSIKKDSSALLTFTLGLLYFQTGDMEKAMTNYQKAIQAFPDFRRAHQNLGVLLVKDGKYQEALPHLTRAIELGAVNATTYGLLGFTYLNLERNISAEACYRNAMILSPQTTDWKLGLAQSFIGQEKYQEAAKILDELLAENPESETLWNLQASVYVQLEKLPDAAVNYEILRKEGKAKPKTLMLLGDIYMMQGSADLALPVYLEAIDAGGGEDADRALRAADILVNQGAYEEAEKLFARIRDVYGANLSEDEEMKLLKLESKVMLATDNSDKAIEVLEQILDRNPLDGEALLMVGDYYAANGEDQKAVFRYDTAAKIEGFEAEANVKHAQLLVQSSKYTEAIELLRRAQKIRPRDNIQKYLDAVERVARASAN